MPKEGKNDQFAKRVCEILLPELGSGYVYTGLPEFSLTKKTPFGHQGAAVDLSGAHAPERLLQFDIGVWHEAYESTRVRLGLAPTPKGVFHFFQNTMNAAYDWEKLQKLEVEGTWIVNLNDDPQDVLSEAAPFVLAAMKEICGTAKDLRKVRDLLETDGGYFITFSAGDEVALIDATLEDWKHLRTFLKDEESPLAGKTNEKLVRKIEKEFGVKIS
jgi:hypothetical protein